MTHLETIELALEALEDLLDAVPPLWECAERAQDTITALRQVREQIEQTKPVAMKFKIYKPTVPDPTRQGINNALLPWVYDQDKSSGFDATMWVTPVATLPPPRQPLSDEEIDELSCSMIRGDKSVNWLCRAIERAHGIGESK